MTRAPYDVLHCVTALYREDDHYIISTDHCEFDGRVSSLYIDTAVCGPVTWSRSLCYSPTSWQVVERSSARTRRSMPAGIPAQPAAPTTMSGYVPTTYTIHSWQERRCHERFEWETPRRILSDFTIFSLPFPRHKYDIIVVYITLNIKYFRRRKRLCFYLCLFVCPRYYAKSYERGF